MPRGLFSHSFVEPSMSVNRKVTVPVGRSAISSEQPPFAEPPYIASMAASRRDFAVRHVGRERPQNGLHLEEGEAGVLAEDPGDNAGDVRRGEAVARRRDPTAIVPRYKHFYSRRPELHGRLGGGSLIWFRCFIVSGSEGGLVADVRLAHRYRDVPVHGHRRLHPPLGARFLRHAASPRPP